MSASRAKLAELRALRAAGKKRLSTYEVEEQGDIYEEVDDEGYKKIIRNRLDQDDFVVDDNGEGYADDGREVWNERTADYGDSESEDDGLPARGKAAKRKREEEKQRQEKINNGISKYFSSGAAASAPKPKVSYRSHPLSTNGSLICCSAGRYCRRRRFHGRFARRSRYQRGPASCPYEEYSQD